MLGLSGQTTTGALTRRAAGGGAGCRNLHRGMRLASGGGLLDVLRLRGLPVTRWSQWQQCYDSLTAMIYISLPLCGEARSHLILILVTHRTEGKVICLSPQVVEPATVQGAALAVATFIGA